VWECTSEKKKKEHPPGQLKEVEYWVIGGGGFSPCSVNIHVQTCAHTYTHGLDLVFSLSVKGGLSETCVCVRAWLLARSRSDDTQ
jgi:hypothetical protein